MSCTCCPGSSPCPSNTAPQSPVMPVNCGLGMAGGFATVTARDADPVPFASVTVAVRVWLPTAVSPMRKSQLAIGCTLSEPCQVTPGRNRP